MSTTSVARAGDLERLGIRLLPWGRKTAIAIDENITFSDRSGRYLKGGKLFRADAKTGRGVLLAENVEAGVVVGDALLWLRHVTGTAASPGRYLLERTPIR